MCSSCKFSLREFSKNHDPDGWEKGIDGHVNSSTHKVGSMSGDVKSSFLVLNSPRAAKEGNFQFSEVILDQQESSTENRI
mmetsp:Transcript_20174/g.39608  ORF Transcript_20174/g.39608 Transcript_20174/m.39608 type:complete len:80 (+) Transcript_20174:52-291(+)